jgi:phosphoglycolate phosphatase-like HAD superfamily hydrolase
MQAVIFDLDHTVFTGNTSLHDGVADLLVILRRLGVNIGALTGGDHRMLVRLEEAGIRGHFDSIVCSEHVADPKDTPGIERLLGLLQAQAHETALVSSSHSDIALARNFGLQRTIRVTHGRAASDELTIEADHVVDDIPTVLDVLE